MTKNSVLGLGDMTLGVEVLKAYHEDDQPSITAAWGANEVLKIFQSEAARVRMMGPVFSGETFGIANRLARHYDRQTITRYAYTFYQQHSDPLRDGSITRPMTYFLSKLTVIQGNQLG